MFTDSWSTGWLLTLVLSCLCALGSSVIFLDDLYDLIVPKYISSRYPFRLKQNYTFLNGSLAFSAGCLLFISLYRLLPKALDYLITSKPGHDVDSEFRWAQTDLLIAYVGGVIACLSMNAFLHRITSELVVHCSHSSDNAHTHSSDRDIEATATDEPHHHHSYDSIDMMEPSQVTSKIHSPATPPLETTIADPLMQPVSTDPRAPLLGPKRKSFIQRMWPGQDDDSTNVGECKGYTLAELCRYKAAVGGASNVPLHYCEIPLLRQDSDSTEDEDPEYRPNPDSVHDSHRELHAVSLHHLTHSRHLHPPEHDHSNTTATDARRHHQDHHDHHDDHHHHVNTPTSRLLLIGVQTTVAITLHKLPEGFVTYVTSTTSPRLGFSIFLSLLVHNFTEGFSMCMPLYYLFAQNKRFKRFAKLKAFAISAILGGVSQPLGALIGYVFLKMNHYTGPDNVPPEFDMQRLDFVFGCSIAVTSGFLTVVGLSMYGLAVQFGGSLQFVMLWCITGIFLIGLSTVLV